MSRYPLPRDFNPRRPLEVRHGFRFAGREYTPGDNFNWRQAGIQMRRVRQLFEAGKLKEAEFDMEDLVAPEPEPTPEPDPFEDFNFPDGLDDIYNMKDLKEIADREGAPTKRSIMEQRDAIRMHRAGNA